MRRKKIEQPDDIEAIKQILKWQADRGLPHIDPDRLNDAINEHNAKALGVTVEEMEAAPPPKPKPCKPRRLYGRPGSPLNTLYGIDGNVLVEGISVKDKHELENILNDCFWIYAQCDLYRRGRITSLMDGPLFRRELKKRRRCRLGITQARSASRKKWLREITEYFADKVPTYPPRPSQEK